MKALGLLQHRVASAPRRHGDSGVPLCDVLPRAVEGAVEAEFEALIRAGWPSESDVPVPPEPATTRRARAVVCAQAAPADDGLCVDPAREGPSDAGHLPTSLLAQLDALEALVELVTSVDPAGVAGAVAAEASQRVHRLVARLEGQRLGWIGQVEAEGAWAIETMQSFGPWLGWKEGLSSAMARRTVAAARALRDHLPATALAARAGSISAEHVGLMVKTTSSEALCAALARPVQTDTPGPSTDFAAEMSVDVSMDDSGAASDDDPSVQPVRVCTGEQMLLGLARERRVDDFAKVAKHFTVVCDPDAQDKAFKDATEREFLQLSPTLGGVQVSGFLTSEHGQLLTVALRAVAGVPAAGTMHPADVRRVDALVDLAQLFLDGGIAGKGAAVRPHLSVHIGWDEFTRLLHTSDTAASGMTTGSWFPDPAPTPQWSPDHLEAQLRAGPATWEDGTGPIPDQVLRRLICDCEVTRIIFGPDSQILNVGRTQRTFTKELRRAIIARDRHCTWPGCDAPPHVCEIHHATRHWADGGDTAPTNGALLCRRHHHQVDTETIAMTYANGWTLSAPGSYQAITRAA